MNKVDKMYGGMTEIRHSFILNPTVIYTTDRSMAVVPV